MSGLDSHVFYRSLRQPPAQIVSGKGITFTLSTGETIIDASAGPAVSCLGHHQPTVTEAVTRQMNQMAYVYSGSNYTSSPIEELASILLADNPGGLAKAIF